MTTKARSAISIERLILIVMVIFQVSFFLFHQDAECGRTMVQNTQRLRAPRRAQEAIETGQSDSTGSEVPGRPDSSKITHAHFGECSEAPYHASPTGLKHPDLRWKWDQVSPKVILEIGGNFGEDLQAFSEMYPAAHVHSFEPVRAYFQYLHDRFQSKLVTGQVALYNLGVSDSDANVSFRIDGDKAASSQYGTVPNSGSHAAAPKFEDVTLRDIHTVFEEIIEREGRAIDVLSINCEGCEYAVLERLRDMGWLNTLQVLQVSWHVSDAIPRRLQRRCSLEQDLPGEHFRIAGIADYGWVKYVARPRLYAVEDKFLGDLLPADISHGNGLPQAAAGVKCRDGVLPAWQGMPVVLDPDVAHMTYPQTMDQDRSLEVIEGKACRLGGDERLLVKVGASISAGNTWQGCLDNNPNATVHIFQAVRLEDKHPGPIRRNRSKVWNVGLANRNRNASYRVWDPSSTVAAAGAGAEFLLWEGSLQEAELRDAELALAEIQSLEARAPDLFYMNCEGCEYEVLQRLLETGRIKTLQRLVIAWHAGGSPWRSRCDLDKNLRESHRLLRAVNSMEWWVRNDIPSSDPFGTKPRV